MTRTAVFATAVLLLAGCGSATSTPTASAPSSLASSPASTAPDLTKFGAAVLPLFKQFQAELAATSAAIGKSDFPALKAAATRGSSTCANAVAVLAPPDAQLAALWQQFAAKCLSAWSDLSSSVDSQNAALAQQATSNLAAATALVNAMNTRLTQIEGS